MQGETKRPVEQNRGQNLTHATWNQYVAKGTLQMSEKKMAGLFEGGAGRIRYPNGRKYLNPYYRADTKMNSRQIEA